jgi:pyridoxamine 5'-phosphate oxidase
MERALEEQHLDVDPLEQLRRWRSEAEDAGQLQPWAMTLATVGEDGLPSARVVLLRGLDQRGLVWFTNHGSRKGRDLAAVPHAAVVFQWDVLARQARATGPVEIIDRDESAAYFATRPRGHQLAAWASTQSEPLASRDELVRAFDEVSAAYPDDVPLPTFWGGYRLRPERLEFWQGRQDRLHDRFAYRRDGDRWRIERLAP